VDDQRKLSPVKLRWVDLAELVLRMGRHWPRPEGLESKAVPSLSAFVTSLGLDFVSGHFPLPTFRG